jgi:hypothetical protein
LHELIGRRGIDHVARVDAIDDDCGEAIKSLGLERPSQCSLPGC